MQWVANLLMEHSLLLLFVVAVLGHIIGKIKIKGVSLGVAAVLFVGLGMNALNAEFALPAAYTSLGLVLFVYSIGIASGPSFFASLKNNGMRNNLLVFGAISVSATLVLAAYFAFQLQPAVAAGLFTGINTNTPALAGLVQMLSSGNLGPDTTQMATLPAVGYSVAYPLGVIGPILAIAFWQKHYKIDYEKDAQRATDVLVAGTELHNKTMLVTNKEYCGRTVKSLAESNEFNVLFGRIRRGKKEWLATREGCTLECGDMVLLVGTPEDTDAAIRKLGKQNDEHISLDHSQHERHHMFVSSNAVAGRKIRELRLPQRFDAMITRVRRGDVGMLAHKDLVLEAGDRVRVIAPIGKEHLLRRYFGDSYRAVSSINLLAIGIGLTLGLLLGAIPVDLPGGVVFRLGDAGGPLVVGLILGKLRRSGPIVWGIPYTANLTLREFGLVLMLAGIGTRSGQTFVDAMQSGSGLTMLCIAAVISLLIPFVFLPIAYKKFKLPFAVVTGMMAATHTQPAVHAYATQQANNDLPNHGYAIAFPTATIVKIILSQVILLALL